ncbi:MAG TPA: hypothetical protein VIK52_03715, partial [Opitutaceae bacterium]
PPAENAPASPPAEEAPASLPAEDAPASPPAEEASAPLPADEAGTPAALAAVPEPTGEQPMPLAATETEDGEFQPGVLRGRVENGRYYAPSNAFDVAIPTLVGDRPLILDNPNIVVFRDDIRTMLTIAAIEMAPIDKWELETTSSREFLITFFRSNVLEDYKEAFPGTSVEGAVLLNDLEGGALLVTTLHPNGSAFETDPIVRNDPATPPPVAKRGNLIFCHGGHVYVLSTELADRVTESSTYATDTATEDRILRERLVEIYSHIRFPDSPPETPTG